MTDLELKHWVLELIGFSRSDKVLGLLEQINGCEVLIAHYQKPGIQEDKSECQILIARYQNRIEQIENELERIALEVWTYEEIQIAKKCFSLVSQKQLAVNTH